MLQIAEGPSNLKVLAYPMHEFLSGQLTCCSAAQPVRARQLCGGQGGGRSGRAARRGDARPVWAVARAQGSAGCGHRRVRPPASCLTKDPTL